MMYGIFNELRGTWVASINPITGMIDGFTDNPYEALRWRSRDVAEDMADGIGRVREIF